MFTVQAPVIVLGSSYHIASLRVLSRRLGSSHHFEHEHEGWLETCDVLYISLSLYIYIYIYIMCIYIYIYVYNPHLGLNKPSH